jgi:hypothetical protein
MIQGLAACFTGLEDPRETSRCDHQLIDILVIAVCAVIACAESWEDIALYGRSKQAWLATFLALPNGIPSQGSRMSLVCDDLEHVAVIPGGLLRLLRRLVWVLRSRAPKLKAILRRRAKLRAAVRSRTRLSSSRKVTSSTQCSAWRVGRRSFTSGLSQNGAGASRLTPLPPSNLSASAPSSEQRDPGCASECAR